jgi:dihydroneopterin aldolase
MGLIAIEGLQFYAHHGYYKEEQVLGGKYTVDIYMQVNTEEASATDDLKKTINYEEVYRLTKAEMEIHSKLIEHVCQRILSRLKDGNFAQVNQFKSKSEQTQSSTEGKCRKGICGT